MSGRLSGKTAIVTGGSQGTGEAIARLFVAEGANVCIADLQVDKGQALCQELGSQADFFHMDVASASDWERLIAHTTQTFGEPTVLINNAAVLDMCLLSDITEEGLTRLFRVNQLGPVLGIQAVVPAMRKAGFGSIVNIGSTDGVFAQDLGLIGYGATKFALRGITRMAAMELGRHAIRVNCLNPDSGNWEMSAPFLPEGIDAARAMESHVQRILSPPPWAEGFHRYHEISAMALFLASDESSGCTGGDFPVDGGCTVGARHT